MLPVAILASGLAMRLRPMTETNPKYLVEIDGEPFLWHQLRLLHENGTGFGGGPRRRGRDKWYALLVLFEASQPRS